MKKTLLTSAVVALAGIGLMAGSALASPILSISGNGASMTYYDIDDGTEDGVVSFSGQFGAVGTEIFVQAGGTTTDDPSLHLNAFVNDVDGTAGVFTFMLEDEFDSLNAGTNGFLVDYSAIGTDKATSTFEATLNGELMASFTQIGTDVYVPGDMESPYSFVLTGTLAGVTSFDSRVAPVPEPATMLLFGTGLVGLVGVARRRKAKK